MPSNHNFILLRASAELAKCINITLNNVLDIGDCLGTNTDYCTTTTPVTKFLTKLITCTLQGILKYGSTEGILWALSGLGQILLNSLGIGNVVTNVPASGHWVATSQTCKDPIRLTTADIGLLGKCVANFADLCPAGTVAQDTVFEKLFDTLKASLQQEFEAIVAATRYADYRRLVAYATEFLWQQARLVLPQRPSGSQAANTVTALDGVVLPRDVQKILQKGPNFY
ncbi:uncharacterized protein LOC144132429 isoform X2 [Amblyomma americanum]